LFAELNSIWDPVSSEAIDKAISVLMNYFDWSLKDPVSAGRNNSKFRKWGRGGGGQMKNMFCLSFVDV
jgi:hypothetical protein